MRSRLANVLAWIGFLSLIFGVIPFTVIATGPTIERALQEQRGKPAFFEVSCQSWNAERQQATGKKKLMLDNFDPHKCRKSGSGVAWGWHIKDQPLSAGTWGWLYEAASLEEAVKQAGFGSYFYGISGDRKALTFFAAIPWLPIGIILYIFTGSFRILPWRK